MSILEWLVPFIIILGVMIFVHEFGHFAVAKLLKIKVEVFSLGFGPRLFGFRKGDTDYRLSVIPLGGYVKMKGENIDEELEHTGDEFLSRSKWQRFLVLVAGPMMNILTAITILAVIAMFYFRIPVYHTKSAEVGSVAAASAAYKAGIKPGDRIILYGVKENPTWYDVEIKTSISPEISIPVVLDRNGERIETTLVPKVQYEGREKVGLSGLLPIQKVEPVTVDKVIGGAPADQGGLKAEDKIVSLNGESVPNFYWFFSSIQNFEGQEIALLVERNGQPVELKMKPRREADGKIKVGFKPGPYTIEESITTRKPFFEAIKFSIERNIEILVLTKEALGQIFSGERKAGDALAGPIGIAEISRQAFKLGPIEYLTLMAVLSLNLGVFNLFPIPVLDGGHIFILMLEGMLGLAGVKLSMRIKEKMLQFGFVMLILLMGFVIINDISKLFTKPDAPPPAAQQQKK